jgi:hypothetical protein
MRRSGFGRRGFISDAATTRANEDAARAPHDRCLTQATDPGMGSALYSRVLDTIIASRTLAASYLTM